jgi:adenylate kinase
MSLDSILRRKNKDDERRRVSEESIQRVRMSFQRYNREAAARAANCTHRPERTVTFRSEDINGTVIDGRTVVLCESYCGRTFNDLG